MWSACCSSCENKKSQEPGSFPSAPALEAAHDTLEANEGELKQELQELSHASGGGGGGAGVQRREGLLL